MPADAMMLLRALHRHTMLRHHRVYTPLLLPPSPVAPACCAGCFDSLDALSPSR